MPLHELKVVCRLISVDPSKRPSAKEVLIILAEWDAIGSRRVPAPWGMMFSEAPSSDVKPEEDISIVTKLIAEDVRLHDALTQLGGALREMESAQSILEKERQVSLMRGALETAHAARSKMRSLMPGVLGFG